MHLHGMFSELENAHGDYRPLKHTIIVKPGERLSFLVITADAPGRWRSTATCSSHGSGHVPRSEGRMSAPFARASSPSLFSALPRARWGTNRRG
jgi:hypothetical protein